MTATRRLQVALPLLLVACGREPGPAGAPAPEPPAARPIVVATIFPLADLTASLAGPDAEVVTLVPAGATPHTFSLQTEHARQIAAAKLIVRVGPGYDDWLAGALQGSSATVIVAMEQTDLLPAPHEAHAEHEDHGHAGEHGADDPHLWLDPVRVREDLLPAIAAALSQALPDKAAGIQSRLSQLQQALITLEATVREQLAPLPARSYIAGHAGWQYWNQRFGLEQVASIEVVPGTEPSARWRKEVIDLARAKGVRCIFTEAQLSPGASRALAEEARLKVLELDMYGGPGVAGRDSYAAMMSYNAKQFAAGLADG